MKKILAANRSEIAVRVFRSATELNLRTVAVYAEEDRFGVHRFKADEAYLVGKGKGPVAAYLDIEGVVSIAKEKGVDLIHPGYGFLSENAPFARACSKAGLTFVGPSPELLEQMGDKVAARQAAEQAGVPTLPATPLPPGPESPGSGIRITSPSRFAKTSLPMASSTSKYQKISRHGPPVPPCSKPCPAPTMVTARQLLPSGWQVLLRR